MKVVSQSELMKNHITGSRLSSQKSLGAVYGSNQSTMLFSLDEKNAFKLTIASDYSSTGWHQIDLGAQLKKVTGAGSEPKVQCFAVSQSSDGFICIVMAVSDTIHGPSKILVSQKISNNLSLDEWKDFSSKLILRTMKDGLVVTDLDIGGLEDESLVMFVANKPGEVPGHYQLNPSVADSTWTYMPLILPQNATACLDAKVGISPKYGMGVYALCKLGDSINLSFTSLPTEFEGHIVTNSIDLLLPTSLNPNKMAVLTKENGYTELYVAGDGLYRFPVKSQSESNLPGLWVADSALFKGVKQLYIANDESEEEVRIWANNEKDALIQLFGTLQEDDFRWGQPLYVASEVTALAAYSSKVAVSESIDSGLVFGKSDGSLSLMVRDSNSAQWRQQSIVLPIVDDDKVYEMPTYTTHIKVFDDDNVPVANQTVEIKASFDCSVLINGKYYALKSAIAKPVETDGDGTITIIYETHDISAPVYTIVTDNSTEQLDPAVNIMKRIDEIKSGNDIATAYRSNGKPLFPKGVKASDCEFAAQKLAELAKVQTSVRSGATHNALKNFSLEAAYSSSCVFKPQGPVGLDSAGVLANDSSNPKFVSESLKDFLVDAGDLLMSLISRSQSVDNFYITQICTDIWNFVVYLEDRIVHFIFTTVSQISSAINWVLQWALGIDFNDIVEWLGFCFNWDDILQNHRVIAKVINMGMDKTIADIDDAKESVHQVFNKIREQLIDNKIVLDQSDAIFKNRVRHEDQEPAACDTPQANWAIQQFKTNVGNITTSQDTIFDDLSELFKDLTDSQIEIIKNAVEQIQTQVIEKFSTSNFGDMVSCFLDIVEGTLINTVENVTLTFLDAVSILVKALKVLINTRWNIPVITYVYEEVICNGDGSKLTLLDVACLFISIPATVIYKTLSKKNMFSAVQAKRIEQAVNWQDFINALQAGEQVHASSNQQLATTAAIFQFIASVARTGSFSAYIVREGTIFKDRSNEVKVCLDWANYCFSIVNLALVLNTATKPDNITRCLIDYSLTVGQLPIRIKDTYLAVYKLRYNRESDLKKPLCYTESVFGVAIAIASAASFIMQIQEEVPQGANPKAWELEYIAKFIQNFTTGLYRSVAFISTLPENSPQVILLKKASVVARGGMLYIRAVSSFTRAFVILDNNQIMDIDS